MPPTWPAKPASIRAALSLPPDWVSSKTATSLGPGATPPSQLVAVLQLLFEPPPLQRKARAATEAVTSKWPIQVPQFGEAMSGGTMAYSLAAQKVVVLEGST